MVGVLYQRDVTAQCYLVDSVDSWLDFMGELFYLALLGTWQAGVVLCCRIIARLDAKIALLGRR